MIAKISGEKKTEAGIEKMQGMFNKGLEDLKNKQR